MQRGGGAAATAPLQTNTGAADRLSVAAPGLCPVQRARQDAHRRTVCVNAGLHGPGVATRTGAGMLLLHLPARGLGGASGKPPPITQAVVAQPRPHKAGGVGGAKLPPHEQTKHAQRPCSKRRRGDASPAPFCCPPPAGDRGRTGGGVYPKGARHNGLLCEPLGAAAVAQQLCIRRRYVEHRHTTTAAGDHSRTVARALLFPLPHCPSRLRTASGW